jgi:Protein of unknown function (DUF2730)
MNAWAPWIAIALSAGALLYSIFKGQSKHTSEKFKAVDSKIGIVVASVDLVKNRVTVLERDMSHLPDKEVTHRLELALANMGSELGRLSERVKPIANMADRMQEAMMEKVMS